MNPDFSGYATRSGIKCSDGRTIMQDAFKHNDGARVPLVWQHGHSDPNNVLGHAELENREDGVYAYGFFNNTDAGRNARISVEHGDIDSLSIYANRLKEEDGNVLHGEIREVSLVLSGANPEARIDQIFVQHSDGFTEEVEDSAIFTSGEYIEHAEGSNTEEDVEESDEPTVADIIDSMDDDQRAVLEYLVGAAVTEGTDTEESDAEMA